MEADAIAALSGMNAAWDSAVGKLHTYRPRGQSCQGSLDQPIFSPRRVEAGLGIEPSSLPCHGKLGGFAARGDPQIPEPAR
jgi:hypothetical protein